jgi:hypothetical protein
MEPKPRADEKTMIDASLDSSGVRDTLSSIEQSADYLDVTIHAQSSAGAGAYRASVEDALNALLGGSAVAVRLTYRVDRTAWSATLTRGMRGFRLLRVPRAMSGWAVAGD